MATAIKLTSSWTPDPSAAQAIMTIRLIFRPGFGYMSDFYAKYSVLRKRPNTGKRGAHNGVGKDKFR